MRALSSISARSPLDAIVSACLRAAEGAVVKAISACHHTRRTQTLPPARIAQTEGDLRRVLGAIRGVRRACPMYDTEDPDLNPSYRYEPPKKKVPEKPTVEPDEEDFEEDFEDVPVPEKVDV